MPNRYAIKVAADVMAKRHSQIAKHGFTSSHDQNHPGEMARAALALIRFATMPEELRNGLGTHPPHEFGWPWEAATWKPQSPRDALISACALLMAELENGDRQVCNDQ